MKIEFENSIKRLSFLCCVPDIKIAWMNPCILDGNVVHKQSNGPANLKMDISIRNVCQRQYTDVVVSTKDVYILDRYYTYSKTVAELKIIVIIAISAHIEYVHPYFCVVYS